MRVLFPLYLDVSSPFVLVDRLLSHHAQHHTHSGSFIVQKCHGIIYWGYAVFCDTSIFAHSRSLRVSYWWEIGSVCSKWFQSIRRPFCVCFDPFPPYFATGNINVYWWRWAILIMKWSILTSWHRNVFCITAQNKSDANLWCFLCCQWQATEHTVE